MKTLKLFCRIVSAKELRELFRQFPRICPALWQEMIKNLDRFESCSDILELAGLQKGEFRNRSMVIVRRMGEIIGKKQWTVDSEQWTVDG